MRETEMNGLVSVASDGEPKTTSLIVAEKFGKDHKDVLRAIENLECSQEFRERNFALSNYLSKQGKTMPMVEITRDGFMFLAMGFTGRAAAEWKEKFIAAFNALQQQAGNSLAVWDQLHRIVTAQTENIGKMLVPVAQITSEMAETKGRVDGVESRVLSLEQVVTDLRPRIQRKSFSEATKHSYRLVVIEYYRRLCPCCQEVEVLTSQGAANTQARYDHWTERNRNWPTDGWLICNSCNVMLERERHKHTEAFSMFQKRLERMQGPSEQLPLSI